jgi:hypothetical protein
MDKTQPLSFPGIFCGALIVGVFKGKEHVSNPEEKLE